ncbi:YciI family protein [Variovorax sp. KK3]|uniref:YciI family protein n=1 Tax=Variovorax sp. KK3 TaxID=1855728 RepID=UPI00097BB337|nr:YciI family protein [Variovorax sp. KK3]
MLFAFHLIDRPDAGDLRTRLRPEHKAYLAEVAERIAFAGPLLANDGTTMVGSLLVIDFAERAAASQWQAQEPFTRSGLYASVAVHGFANLWPQRAGFAPTA